MSDCIYVVRVSRRLYGPFATETEAEACGKRLQEAAAGFAIRVGAYVEIVRPAEEAFARAVSA